MKKNMRDFCSQKESFTMEKYLYHMCFTTYISASKHHGISGFAEGFLSICPFGNNELLQLICRSEQDALSEDWYFIGSDMYNAMKKVIKEQDYGETK